ncbi:MAG TPA: ABC transporter ATP-binding protein, partial [Bellilinea sp.]|nr:ABC transporter ATP-binding protein [Bellilinea sp.]
LSKFWATLNPTVLWVTHNIAEAVKLADRILVFSPSPGTIIADLPIELPRPRRESNPAFHELVQSVRTYLKGHQDA